MVGSLRRCVPLRSLAGMGLAVIGIFLASTLRPVRVWAFGGSSPRAEASRIPPASVEITPDAVSFVDVPAGETYSQTVRIRNVSENTFQIKKIAASSADFSITGILLPVVVAPGTNETFTISYRGARAEARAEGQISILTSSGDTPIVLQVRTSTVMGQKELTASEASIDFEDIAVGSSSKKEVSLFNAGNRDVSVSGISVSGVVFSVSGAGALKLSPGQRFTVNVNFALKNEGRQAGNLKVLGGDGGPLLEMPLSGSGAASSQSVVKLNWEESPASTAGYVVYRAADPSGPFMRISTQAVPSTEYVDTGLAAGHTYYYVVTSVGTDDVESEYSAPSSATVPGA